MAELRPFQNMIKMIKRNEELRKAQAKGDLTREEILVNYGDPPVFPDISEPGFAGYVPQRPIPQMVPMSQPVQMNQPVQPQSPAGAGLLPPASPAEAGIQKGGIAGLLGGAITRMMDRALYSTPTFGGNFITEQAGGEVALRRMESAAAQKEQEAAFKAAEIQAKAGKGPELTAPIIKQIEKFQGSSKGLDIVNQMLNLIPAGGTGGFPAMTDKTISGLAAIFGVATDTPRSKKLEQLRSGLLDSFRFLVGQGQISKSDYEAMKNAVEEPGNWTTNPKELVSSLNYFKNILEGNRAGAAAVITKYGLRPADFTRPYLSVTNIEKKPE